MAILITRPIEQAEILAAKINGLLNLKTVIFPAITIIKINHPFTDPTVINTIDLAIFTSPAAIQHFSEPLPSHIPIFTVGKDSAEYAQQKFTSSPIIYPRNHIYNSESLLNLPELQSDQIQHKKILILQGQKNNAAIADTLRSRGSIVINAIIYTQTLPVITTRPDLSKINLIICTSQLSLFNLILLFKQHKLALLHKQLLVSSEKLAQAAQELGFAHPCLIAKNASDEGLLDFLRVWRQKAN